MDVEGRSWIIEKHMCDRFIDHMETLKKWTPRKRFTMYKSLGVFMKPIMVVTGTCRNKKWLWSIVEIFVVV